MSNMYFDDFMDILQPLTQEFTSGLEKIEVIDSQVEETMECIQRNIDTLFSKADSMRVDKVDAKFETVMKKSEKVVDLSDSKIQLVNHMQGALSKYVAKLDKDIFKLKMELEDGHSGSTAIIEKRVLESKQQNFVNQDNKCKSNKRPYGGRKK